MSLLDESLRSLHAKLDQWLQVTAKIKSHRTR